MNILENDEEFTKYKNTTLDKLSKIFNTYSNKIISLKVETKDIIYENLFNQEAIIEQQNADLLKKIKYVKGLTELFNFSDFNQNSKPILLNKKRKSTFMNETDDLFNNFNNQNINSINNTLINLSDNLSINNDSISNKTGDDAENIELKGMEIYTDLVPTIQKIRNFTKTRLPVIYSTNSVKMQKYFKIKSQLDKNPNYDFSLSSSDLDEKPIDPSILCSPSEKKILITKVIKKLKYYYPKMEIFLAESCITNQEIIKTKTLLYGLIEYQGKKPQYYYYRLYKNDEFHKIIDYRFVKIAIVRKYGGKIQNILKSAEKKFKNFVIRKDNEGNTMIKGEINIKYESLVNYFLCGGKSVEEIAYIQFEVFLFKSDLFRDVQTSTDIININQEERDSLDNFQKDLNILRANM